MKRIINTSVPVVVATIRTPLSTSLTIRQSGENGGPLTQAQDTQQNPQAWIPDRKLHPLILSADFVAKDTSTGEDIASGYEVKWYTVNGETQTQITTTTLGADYYLETDEESGDLTGRLVVTKNVDYRQPITIRCIASYTDNLRQELYTAESTVTLSSTNMPDESYLVSIQAPAVVGYNPIYPKAGTTLASGALQNGSKFRITAKTTLGSNDVSGGVYYFWYIDGDLLTGGTPLTNNLYKPQYDPENQLSGKGLGTDTIVLDMDYAADFKVQAMIGTFSEVTSPTGNPKTKGYYEISSGSFIKTNDTTVNAAKVYYTAPSAPNLPCTDERRMKWTWPDIDNIPVSRSGNVVRSSSGMMEFEAMVQADGHDIDNTLVDEYIRLNWKTHAMNSSTVEDAGWGREIAIDHSVLNRTGGEHVEVYADTCLLEAYAFVTDKEENGSLIIDDQGRYVVCRV